MSDRLDPRVGRAAEGTPAGGTAAAGGACPRCGARLRPGRLTCVCGHRLRSPWLRLPEWLAVLLAVGGGLAGLLVWRLGGSDRHTVVGWTWLGAAALAALLWLGLRTYHPVAWYAWTVLLGGMVGVSMIFLLICLGDSEKAPTWLAFVPGILAGVYAGLAWRTDSRRTWASASTVYLLADAVLLGAIAVLHARYETFPLVVGQAVVAFAAAALLVPTYAVGVRWMYRVGRGWTGARVGE